MIKTSTRPERRREELGRNAPPKVRSKGGYAPTFVANSKYEPHRGAKEQGKYAPNMPLHRPIAK